MKTKTPTLTAAQMEALAPFERHFRSAIGAAWTPWPGSPGVALMKETMKALGSNVNYKGGCNVCLLNLVRDLGRIYFANKAAAAQAPVEESPAKATETPAGETKDTEAVNSSEKKKKSRKTAKNTQK